MVGIIIIGELKKPTYMEVEFMLSEYGFMICEHLNCKEIHDRFFSGRTDGLSAFEHINYAYAVLRK